MSKRSKTKSQDARRKLKRARKAAQQARYEAYRDAGQNSKSKRARQNAKKKKTVRANHPDGPCGNVGCLKCFPTIHYDLFMKKGVPHHMPQWMYNRYKKEMSS